MSPFVSDKALHSPFFIFVDGGQAIGDEDLVAMFGSDPLERIESQQLRSMTREESSQLLHRWSYLVVAETDRWKLIADDWLYTLWHRKTTQSRIWDLAAGHAVLTFSVGDSDNAHDLRYFSDGKLAREWVVDDKFGGGNQRVLIDDGNPLPGEGDLLGRDDLIEHLLDVAAASGFDLRDGLSAARVWKTAEINDQYFSTQRTNAGNEKERRTHSWKRR